MEHLQDSTLSAGGMLLAIEGAGAIGGSFNRAIVFSCYDRGRCAECVYSVRRDYRLMVFDDSDDVRACVC